MESNNKESEVLKQKIQKLLSENGSLSEEVRTGQENLRLSAAQATKLGNELNEFRSRLGATTQESETYKQRIQKLLSENTSLGD